MTNQQRETVLTFLPLSPLLSSTRLLFPLLSALCLRRAALAGHRPPRARLGARRRPASATWPAQRLVSLGLEPRCVWTKAFQVPECPYSFYLETSGQPRLGLAHDDVPS